MMRRWPKLRGGLPTLGMSHGGGAESDGMDAAHDTDVPDATVTRTARDVTEKRIDRVRALSVTTSTAEFDEAARSRRGVRTHGGLRAHGGTRLYCSPDQHRLDKGVLDLEHGVCVSHSRLTENLASTLESRCLASSGANASRSALRRNCGGERGRRGSRDHAPRPSAA